MSLKRAGRSKANLMDGEVGGAASGAGPPVLEAVFHQDEPSDSAGSLQRHNVTQGVGRNAATDASRRQGPATTDGGGGSGGCGEPITLESLESNGLLTTIIPDRVHFASFSGHPRNTNDVLYFTTDFHLMYTPYFADFGPLNLAAVVRFVQLLRKRVDDPHQRQQIVYYSGHGAHQRANAACLMACFCVLHLGKSAEEAYALFDAAYPPLLPFRDASYGISTFNLTILDIVQGLCKAKTLGWIDAKTFDVDTYEQYDALENGDWNWIVPKQIIAFSSPVDGVAFRGVQHVAHAFRKEKVRSIVRLNEPLYDKRGFTSLGIELHDVQYPDGSCPNDHILNQCLHIMERAVLMEGGAVAVHCKAGLGRTGTMVGAYIMKHYGFTAREAIAWCRLCRPGSVIGPQQTFLEQVEHRFRRGALLGQAVAPNGAVLTPLPNRSMYTRPHKGGPTGCMKKPLVPNPTLHPTQSQLPATITAGQQHHAAVEAHAQLYDASFATQQQMLRRFKYDSSRTDAIKTSKSSTRRAMYILDGSQKRRTHGEITGRNPETRSSSSMTSNVRADAITDGHCSVSQLRSSSQMSFLGSTSAEMTVVASSTFHDQTLKKHRVTTGAVGEVLPELVAMPSALGAAGPGWLRPTAHVPRASSSLW